MTYGGMRPEALETIACEKIRIACEDSISLREFHFVRNHAEASARIVDQAKIMTMRLSSYILGLERERLKRPAIHIERQWPHDWWEAVKERFAPKWFTRRWPVAYETLAVHHEAIDQGIYNVCPHVNMKTPDQRQVHFQWLASKEPMIDRWRE